MADTKAEQPSLQESTNGYSEGAPRKRGGVINTLYPPGPKPGAGGRFKNHCRKFWWCDLLLTIIIVLVILLPILYVAIPHKAQSELDKSTLEVTSQDVSNPTPDGAHLKLVSVAKSSSSYHPTLDGFRAGLSLAGKDPFIYINVPETKTSANTEITVDQDIQFASLDNFIEYNKVVMGSESFDVYMNGKTKLHLSGLPAYNVDFNKKVTMKGLNKLQGLNITGVKILSGTTGANAVLPDGSNMVGTVYIPNPSVMTLDLGNVTMNLEVDGKSIGTSLLPDLVLKPGNNTVPMQSTVDQLGVIGLIGSKYKDAVLPIDIKGNSSIRNGQHLQYFESAIQSNTIRLNLDVGPALQAIGINSTGI